MDQKDSGDEATYFAHQAVLTWEDIVLWSLGTRCFRGRQALAVKTNLQDVLVATVVSGPSSIETMRAPPRVLPNTLFTCFYATFQVIPFNLFEHLSFQPCSSLGSEPSSCVYISSSHNLALIDLQYRVSHTGSPELDPPSASEPYLDRQSNSDTVINLEA